MKNVEYKTSDLGIAVTLSYFGYELIRLENHPETPKKKIFVFLDKTDKPIEEMVQKYWNDELKVEPMEFFRLIKTTKARIYADIL